MIYSQLWYIKYRSNTYLYHVVHYSPSTYSPYNWKFLPFDYLLPILPYLPPCHPLVSTNLMSFFWVCFWSTTDIQHYASSWYASCDLLFLDVSKVITMIHIVAICHLRFTYVLTIFPTLYISHLWPFILLLEVVPFYLFHLFLPSLHPCILR